MNLKQLKKIRESLRRGFASGQLYTACSILIMVAMGYYVTYAYSSEPISKTDFVLDTVATITIYQENDTQLLEDAFALCRSYESIFSATNPSSELYQLNEQFQSQSHTPIPISYELGNLIDSALHFAETSKGAFDPTIGVLTTMWDFTSDTPTIPEEEHLLAALPLIDYQSLTIDGLSLVNNAAESTNLNPITITNHMLGTRIDLGAIAKGYIADQLKVFLLEQGVTSAYINLGGNIVCIGSKPQNQPFQVGIQKPFEEYSELIAQMSVEDASVVTCGIYERSFSYADQLYHHILNPKTGYSYVHDLTSVTIISPHSIDGDALSTICYALGIDEGIALIEALPEIHGIFIDKQGYITYTKGFQELFDVIEVE
ncbi:MAG: FAD:protein FMN transferase [Eubacteriales bacterium]